MIWGKWQCKLCPVKENSKYSAESEIQGLSLLECLGKDIVLNYFVLHIDFVSAQKGSEGKGVYSLLTTQATLSKSLSNLTTVV